MNMKNKLTKMALVALVGLGTAALAGCDNGQTNDGRTEVVFWHTMGKSNQEKLQVMIESFEAENPDIKITHAAQGGYTDIESKILKAIPAKTTPTMAFCYPDHVANYIDAGAAVELTPYVNHSEIGLTAEELKDYEDAGFWNEGKSYGRGEEMYSVPFSKSTEVMFVNTSWLISNGFYTEENGVKKAIIPTKWENEADPTDYTAMFNLAKAIRDKVESDSNPNNDNVIPLGYDSDDNMFITLSEQYGLPYTSFKNGQASIDFLNDGSKAMVSKLKGYYDKKYIVTKGSLPNNDYTSNRFKTQEIIMSIGSTGGTSYNVPAVDSDGVPLFNVEVARIPQVDANNPKMISQGPSITFFKNSKISQAQIEASWKFYKHITKPEYTASYAILTGYEPVRESAYKSAEYTAHLAKLGTADETLYTKVANLTCTPAVKNAYFFSDVFVGSSTARQSAGGIISQVFLDVAYVNTAFDEAYDNAIFAL